MRDCASHSCEAPVCEVSKKETDSGPCTFSDSKHAVAVQRILMKDGPRVSQWSLPPACKKVDFSEVLWVFHLEATQQASWYQMTVLMQISSALIPTL
jgi:hypothetical protein